MTKKIGISLRDDLYEWAVHEVEEGRAESVSALIAEVVARVNEDLPPAACVREFGLFDKELHADDGELTRTNKVRRATIHSKYESMIADLYARKAGVGT